jgi:acetoacetyl-CoA synthetase
MTPPAPITPASITPAPITPAPITPPAKTGGLVWAPDPASVADTAITRFAAEAGRRTGLDLSRYADLHAWSVRDLDAFWAAVADFFGLGLGRGPGSGQVLADDRMPGASWFPGARLSYAAQALRPAADQATASTVAVTAVNELGETATLTWAQLRDQAGAFASALRGLGVKAGDRVVGYLPNVTEALVAFLGSASIGAVWSACAQDYSAAGAAARFGQLEPAVLVAADGYRWNGQAFDRRGEVAELQRRLPSLLATVHVRHLGLDGPTGAGLSWDSVVSGPVLAPEATAFDAPLWVLFSSGTTGRPKGLVHSHGGIVLEQCKLLGLHLGIGPGRPLFWYTNANWVMWNIAVSSLLVGAPVVLYDGSPVYPDPMRLWRIAADHQAAALGVSPGYLAACGKAGLRPGAELDLSGLRTLGVTGAPLTAGPYYWVRDQVGAHVQTSSTSGGTDVASGFAGGTPVTPVYAGEISGPLLGVAMETWDEAGRPVTGQVGELVVTRPMPSMPLRFWADPDGERYRDAYFARWPGVWRHGDWAEITAHGGVIVSGRSDATLNRHGVRLGSADIYTAIEALPAVSDSLVIGAELGDGGYWLALFVVLADGGELSGELTEAIKARIRTETSPRHVPDDVIAVPALPHTRTGKRLEIPVKRLIQGQPLAAVAGADAVDDYGALAQFTVYAGGPGQYRKDGVR